MMNGMTNDHKLQILMMELQERYEASHRIRERSTQFVLWISGMAIGLAWLLLSEGTTSPSQRLALTILAIVLYMGALFIVRGLQRGAQKNREVMICVESTLGMYDKGSFLPDSSLLPPEYGQTTQKWSHDSCTLQIWLLLVAASLVFLIWVSPHQQASTTEAPHSQQTTGGKNHV